MKYELLTTFNRICALVKLRLNKIDKGSDAQALEVTQAFERALASKDANVYGAAQVYGNARF